MRQDVAIVFKRRERKREKSRPSSLGFKGRRKVAICFRKERKKESKKEGRKRKKGMNLEARCGDCFQEERKEREILTLQLGF